MIGIAINCRRIDTVQKAIELSKQPEALLGYTYTIATEVVKHPEFRAKVLNMILLVYHRRQANIDQANFDFFKIAKCQYALDKAESTGQLLEKLMRSDTNYLQGYQIAFDLIDKENQVYTQAVISHIEKSDLKADFSERQEKLLSVLNGTVKDTLTRQFMKKNNHADMLLIGKVKDIVAKDKKQNAMLHSAVVWMNGMMNAQTTNDSFVKDNLSWVAQATNWNRFSATATLGMIHQWNTAQAQEVLNPYLNGGVGLGGGQASPYATAGAYFAHGLIHVNQMTPEISTFYKDGFRNAGNSEVIMHGVSLGLGLAGMATKDNELYEELKNQMFSQDNAIIGEAAAYGMGMVMVGSADEDAIEEMITHAAENQHEKIIRALSVSLALVMYGRQSQADGLIEQMMRSKDSIIRYGAMFTIGCAYAGTNNPAAIRRLLKSAVNETSDDVKRAALMNLGLLTFREPKQLPTLVKHLAVSYNPHLRYGAAMALGIGLAGSGSSEALKILAQLAQDKEDFVKQGALIALSMVFI